MLAVHPFDTTDTHKSIGCSHSYYFYQQLNTTTKRKLESPDKQIIPSIPRPKTKLPKNSPLSPIRSQKFKAKQQIEPEQIFNKRPYPLVTTFSSPASLQTNHKKRHRKVSFDEKVTVVCTIFDEDEDEEIATERRHSTGEQLQQPKLIPPLTTKITRSLKQFKNRLLFV